MKYILGLICLTAFGATTATWEMNSYQDFLRGRMSGLSVTRDGRLTVGPKIETLFTSDQPEIWSVAQGPDGSLYLGTGNRGRLFRVDASGKSSVVWTADEPEIFAVAVDAKGVVYAGTSPDGKVYRIENGKASEYFDPQSRYIWALKIGDDGALFVGTGDQGKIFRVTGAGRGEVYYETGQSNVTSLAIDREGRLLAGSEPNGLLYRITAKDKAFVLYDANLPEIRAIVPAADGSIYAAALGGSVAKRVGAATTQQTTSTPAIVAPPISITVTDSQQGGINPAPKLEAPKPVAPQPAQVIAPVTTVENTGVEKSAIYKIHPDNTVETLWSSKEENAYDIALAGSDVLFITDSQGRIYRLGGDRKPALVGQANEGEATRLLESSNGLIAATGNLGKIVRLAGEGSGGWYESPVHDSGSVARWGRLSWHGDSSVVFKTRTGNSARADATWSDWAALNLGMVASPNARFIQWRAELSAGGIDSVTIAYLPQNQPPVLKSVTVSPKSAASAAAASYSVTVTETPESPSAQTLSRPAAQQIQVGWQAEDPDGDKLLYSLYFRGEDEREWKLLRANMTETTYLLDGDVLADGRYFFRVTASDRASNPASVARETEIVSAPVLIDNTPPVVHASAARRSGAGVEIDIDAADVGSALRKCEYSIDAGPWSPVEAVDGVTDSASEKFVLRLASFPAGEHLVVVRVYDAAGNAGLAKVVVR